MRRGRLPRATGDVRVDAVGELRWSMAGGGLTVDKLPFMTTVLGLPVVAAALRGAAPEAGPRVAFDVVVAAARDLGAGVHARLLRNSLAVDYEGDGKDLTARRGEFARAHNAAARSAGNRNYVGESARAQYDVEQEMLGALVTLLGAPPAAFIPASDLAVAGTSGSPWTYLHSDVTYRLRGRAGFETEIVQLLRAAADGLETMDVSYFCGAGEGDPAAFELYEGGTVVDSRSVGQPGFRSATVRFPNPLRRGETHRVRFDLRYPGSATPDSWFTIHLVRPADRLTLRVAFDPVELPGRVWVVHGLLAAAHGGDPDDSAPLEPDPTGCVETSFAHPSLGRSYGVAWSW